MNVVTDIVSTDKVDIAREMRSAELHRVLRCRSDARTIEAVRGLSELWNWPRNTIEIAIADLVADGRLADDAHGRLIVRRRTAS